MKAAGVREIKKELKFKSQDELVAIINRLATFKKENKELLTYLIFESENEESYRDHIREYMDAQFKEIKTGRSNWTKKGVRKLLRETKRFIRYSPHKDTEVELLLHFCELLSSQPKWLKRNHVIRSTYEKQLEIAEKRIGTLHEDLQYDYMQHLEELQAN